jgi:hypothetical protein
MPEAPRHPYADIPARAHWMRSVAGRPSLEITDWYRPRFPIDGLAIATAGSCFAQHIGRRMKDAGFRYIDTEPAPGFLMPATRREYGYDLYSARYGNVYTTRQLLQLFQRAFGDFEPADDHWPWKDGVVDPFRPTIEPEPYASVDEMRRSRRHHLERVRAVFETADLLVFTLGLTECFASRRDGAVFPVAPGVNGGTWRPDDYVFHNFGPAEVVADLHAFLDAARRVRPGLRLLLTVSPVPLMATASGEHVAVATMRSKSTLRAAAAMMVEAHEGVDYFPSYEIVASPAMRGGFFEDDLRSVSSAGVDHVMKQFFAAHAPPAGVESGAAAAAAAAPPPTAPAAVDEDALACDEELLRTFGA